MSLSAYAVLAVCLPRDYILERGIVMNADELDSMIEAGHLYGYRYDEGVSNYLLAGIPVYKKIDVMEQECIVIDFSIMGQGISHAKDIFKNMTGLDGRLMLVGYVSY